MDLEHRFCESCGAPLAEGTSPIGKPSASVTIGDIGLIRGTLDASTHIGTQTNISGPVSIQIQPTQPGGAELLARGRQLLGAQAYSDAIGVLRTALCEDPSNAQGSLLLGLALLKGRSPDVVHPSVIRQAEACLMTAVQDAGAQALALIALGVLKHDHYVANGMSAGYPSLEQIVRDLQAVGLSPQDKQLLVHLRASARAKELLGVDW
jgi:hypothetical protein